LNISGIDGGYYEVILCILFSHDPKHTFIHEYWNKPGLIEYFSVDLPMKFLVF